MTAPRFVSLLAEGRASYRLMAYHGVIDLSDQFAARWPTPRDFAADNAFDRLAEAAAGRRRRR